MKAVSDSLGVARSALLVRLRRPADWRDGRRQRRLDDGALVEELLALVAELPSYGYRHTWDLLRRRRQQ